MRVCSSRTSEKETAHGFRSRFLRHGRLQGSDVWNNNIQGLTEVMHDLGMEGFLEQTSRSIRETLADLDNKLFFSPWSNKSCWRFTIWKMLTRIVLEKKTKEGGEEKNVGAGHVESSSGSFSSLPTKRECSTAPGLGFRSGNTWDCLTAHQDFL